MNVSTPSTNARAEEPAPYVGLRAVQAPPTAEHRVARTESTIGVPVPRTVSVAPTFVNVSGTIATGKIAVAPPVAVTTRRVFPKCPGAVVNTESADRDHGRSMDESTEPH